MDHRLETSGFAHHSVKEKVRWLPYT